VRSLVYAGVRDLQWREASAPSLLGDEDALIRPIAAAACDLDRFIVQGLTPFPAPFAIGHEAVGEVIDVGEAAAVDGLRPGQVVVIPWHLSCERCSECLAGRPGNCTATPAMAAFGNPLGGLYGGLFDDVVRVPYASRALTPVPDGVAPALAAAVGDNLSDAFGAVAPTLRANPEARILVMGGLPSLGLLIAAAAATLGAPEVVYVDEDADRAQRASMLGATSVVTGPRPDRVDGRFDLAVEVALDPRALTVAIRSLRPGGHLVIRSIYFGRTNFPYFEQYTQGVTIHSGLPHVTPHAASVLELLRTGTLDPTPALTLFELDAADTVLLEPPPNKPVFLRPASDGAPST
jgi:threonine dehydrogenase-like Zn-dependent dehydrogenase